MTPLTSLTPTDSTAESSLAVPPLLANWPLEEALLDVDLSLESRTRVSALPWRGQFSPMTVAHLLAALAPKGALVLDPFVGSGTSLLESARLGHPSVGLDVNPAAIAFAQCAALASLDPKDREQLLREASSSNVHVAPPADSGKPIELAHALALLAAGSTVDEANARLRDLIDSLPPVPVPTRAILGDARATGLPTASASFVVTSPPYINVFNYHQVGRPISDNFGWPVLAAARSEIGSNRQNRSNRFRTVVQYAIDMALTLNEIARVLAPGGTAVLVVGRTSRVRGVSFFNADIVARLVERLELFGARSRAERRFVSRFGTGIAEDVLVMHASAASTHSSDQTQDVGRTVGMNALEDALPTADTAAEIRSAIADATEISASPIASIGL